MKSYDEDSPNEKTAARGVKMFKPGSRKDVQRRPGAFLLADVYPGEFNPRRLATVFFVADWDRFRNRATVLAVNPDYPSRIQAPASLAAVLFWSALG